MIQNNPLHSQENQIPLQTPLTNEQNLKLKPRGKFWHFPQLFTIAFLWIVIVADTRTHWLIIFMPMIVTFLFYKYYEYKGRDKHIVSGALLLFAVATALVVINILLNPYIIVKGYVTDNNTGLPVANAKVSVTFFAPVGWDGHDSQTVSTETDSSGNFLFIKRTIPKSTIEDPFGAGIPIHNGPPKEIDSFSGLMVDDYRYDIARTRYEGISTGTVKNMNKLSFGFFKIYNFTINLTPSKNKTGGTVLASCRTAEIDTGSISKEGKDSLLFPVTCDRPRLYGYIRNDFNPKVLTDILKLEAVLIWQDVDKLPVWKLKTANSSIAESNCSGTGECFSRLTDARQIIGDYKTEITPKDGGVYIIKTSEGKFAKMQIQHGNLRRLSLIADIAYQTDGTFDLQNRDDAIHWVP